MRYTLDFQFSTCKDLGQCSSSGRANDPVAANVILFSSIQNLNLAHIHL